MSSNQNTPRVSIIIPVFNKSKWIEETLKSVVSQSYSNWECIIIDDGSTDNSLTVINEFIEKTPASWRVFTQPNQGQCVARNRGIEESSGEFIAFLDGDDCWAENKLEVQVNLLDENPDASLVICPYRIYREGEGRGRIVYHRDTDKMLKNWLNLRGFGAGTESTGLVRKKYLTLMKGFDPRLSTSAGLDLTLRLSNYGRILTSKDTYMKYRIHTGQWHSNLDILAQDLALLRAVHSDSVDIKEGVLLSEHEAYLRLHELRQDFSIRKVIDSSLSPRAYFYLAVLVFYIVRRNLVARARALFPNILTRIPSKLHRDLFT